MFAKKAGSSICNRGAKVCQKSRVVRSAASPARNSSARLIARLDIADLMDARRELTINAARSRASAALTEGAGIKRAAPKARPKFREEKPEGLAADRRRMPS